MPLKRERRPKKKPPHKSVLGHIDAGESLQLRNPHSILTALKVRPTDVDELRVSKNAAQSKVWSEIIDLERNHSLGVETPFGGEINVWERNQCLGVKSPPGGEITVREWNHC